MIRIAILINNKLYYQISKAVIDHVRNLRGLKNKKEAIFPTGLT